MKKILLDIRNSGGQLRKKPYMKCIFCFSIIAIFLTIGFSFMIHLIDIQKINSHFINVSGRQRMLSQRTTLFALYYVNSNSKKVSEEYRTLLEESVNLFEKNHYRLLKRSKNLDQKDNNGIILRKMYLEEPMNIDEQVRSHIARMRFILSKDYKALKISSPAVKISIKQSATDLLDSLDAIVEHYESRGKEISERLHSIEKLVWLITLVLLSISLYRIIRNISKTMKEKDNEAKEMVLAIIVFYNHEFNNKLASSMIYLDEERENIGDESFTNIFDPLLDLTQKIKRLHEVFQKEGFQYESYIGGETKIFKL